MNRPEAESGTNGTLFFDGGCGLCSTTERRWRGWLKRRGFATAFLQDETRAAAIPLELRADPPGVILLSDRVRVGVDALLEILATSRSGRLVRAIVNLPGIYTLSRAMYGAIARRRYRISRVCRLLSAHEATQPPARP